ncbi:MAG: 1-deoxy-D-xylulose-5-phosphate reductoisomerase, partial [Gammaproteobacteria bacterium]|nr:1-deoxy-D-xylulose-5-phosphate reductoisomerase [Gammaproteobacteria bacterium]
PAILNAANEVAVQAFLDRQIPFTGIARVVGEVLENLPVAAVSDLRGLLAIDREARGAAERMIVGGTGPR